MREFRTKKRENVYVLKVAIVKKGKQQKLVTEIIDAYEGKVGERYANNLLFRLANQVLAGTVYEKIAWEKYETKIPSSKRKNSFIKNKEEGTYAIALMEWYSKIEDENELLVPVG